MPNSLTFRYHFIVSKTSLEDQIQFTYLGKNFTQVPPQTQQYISDSPDADYDMFYL